MQIEASKRLKDSLLWQLQHSAYMTYGADAWGTKGVPFYLTSNPLIAKQFAQVLLGYCRDLKNSSNLDFNEPFYIFDLGAGPGRLGYLILKHLIPLVHDTISNRLRVSYVMTDMVKENLEFLKSHIWLQPFIESGNLDFALYHHDQTSPLELIQAKEELQKDSLKNPIALVCTYYFDTVPQDYFRIRRGQLEEGRVTLSVPGEVHGFDPRKLDPALIMQLEATYDYRPVANPEAYYSDPDDTALLLDYQKLFNDACFLFPSGGLESLRYFSDLSNNRLLMLAADQGVATEEQVRIWKEPVISRHASFSMEVSYHLLARYFKKKGGIGLLTSFPDPTFVVMCGILGEGGFSEASFAFRQEVDGFEPVEYWKITDFKPELLDAFSLEQILLFVKLGNWDPNTFHLFYHVIQSKLEGASDKEKNFLVNTIKRVWDRFYPVHPQEGDFVMNLGVLLFKMKKYEEALYFFKEARHLSGDHPQLLKNLAAAYHLLGEEEMAINYLQQALTAKDPLR